MFGSLMSAELLGIRVKCHQSTTIETMNHMRVEPCFLTALRRLVYCFKSPKHDNERDTVNILLERLVARETLTRYMICQSTCW